MSGGHYDYKYFQVELLADEIQNDIDGGFTSKSANLDGSDYDKIGDCTPDQKLIILNFSQQLADNLKEYARLAKELEWYLSGDTGIETFLNRIKYK